MKRYLLKRLDRMNRPLRVNLIIWLTAVTVYSGPALANLDKVQKAKIRDLYEKFLDRNDKPIPSEKTALDFLKYDVKLPCYLFNDRRNAELSFEDFCVITTQVAHNRSGNSSIQFDPLTVSQILDFRRDQNALYKITVQALQEEAKEYALNLPEPAHIGSARTEINEVEKKLESTQRDICELQQANTRNRSSATHFRASALLAKSRLLHRDTTLILGKMKSQLSLFELVYQYNLTIIMLFKREKNLLRDSIFDQTPAVTVDDYSKLTLALLKPELKMGISTRLLCQGLIRAETPSAAALESFIEPRTHFMPQLNQEEAWSSVRVEEISQLVDHRESLLDITRLLLVFLEEVDTVSADYVDIFMPAKKDQAVPLKAERTNQLSSAGALAAPGSIYKPNNKKKKKVNKPLSLVLAPISESLSTDFKEDGDRKVVDVGEPIPALRAQVIDATAPAIEGVISPETIEHSCASQLDSKIEQSNQLSVPLEPGALPVSPPGVSSVKRFAHDRTQVSALRDNTPESLRDITGSWKITFRPKVMRSIDELNSRASDRVQSQRLRSICEDLVAHGVPQNNHINLSALAGLPGFYHCHLSGSHSRVMVWRIESRQERTIRVYYLGPHPSTGRYHSLAR